MALTLNEQQGGSWHQPLHQTFSLNIIRHAFFLLLWTVWTAAGKRYISLNIVGMLIYVWIVIIITKKNSVYCIHRNIRGLLLPINECFWSIRLSSTSEFIYASRNSTNFLFHIGPNGLNVKHLSCITRFLCPLHHLPNRVQFRSPGFLPYLAVGTLGIKAHVIFSLNLQVFQPFASESLLLDVRILLYFIPTWESVMDTWRM